jgi:hypothetical protein
MRAPLDKSTEPDAQLTTEKAIWSLFERCLYSARFCSHTAGALGLNLPNLATIVEKLISDSRAIMKDFGCSQRDSDSILFTVYTNVHWDWNQPSDRVFETLLEFELAEFFKESGMSN